MKSIPAELQHLMERKIFASDLAAEEKVFFLVHNNGIMHKVDAQMT
jgi:hypothetical protein